MTKRFATLALCGVFLCGLAFAQNVVVAAAREYLRYTREVRISQPDKQNYLVIDAPIWAHARGDLSDVRLYEKDAHVPYALSEELAQSSNEERAAHILNLGVRGGRTEFDLDVGGEAEYNQVQLHTKATNFVATATAYGSDALAAGTEREADRKLSTSTLYDFSREGLGNNFALRMPMATFRYLHVSITPAISPGDITGASTSARRDTRATWISAGRCHSPELINRTTRFACDLDPGVPVGRILITVPAGVVNFRRAVSVSGAQGTPLCSFRDSISRIRRKSGGKEVVSEDLAINFCASKELHIVIEIDNGDNAPLTVEKAEPQSLERRIYFDPAGKSAIRLYYGDEKLSVPVYDYARFFHKEADAVQVVLGAESLNPGYTGRPDERPWSERHKWVLWGAMLLAVLVLAILALRGLTSATPTQK
ncbi:MAG: hypothetical protein WCB11_03385 [Terriglobales bacterium]